MTTERFKASLTTKIVGKFIQNIDPNLTLPVSSKNLIIIGASTRAACQLAVQAGFNCQCIDQFSDTDLLECAQRVLISTRWPSDVAGQARQALVENSGASILLAGGIENSPDLIRDLAKLAPIASCSADQIEHLRDPVAVQQRLLEAGLPALALQVGDRATNSKDDQDHQTGGNRRRWIRKRFASAGGIGIQLVSDSSDAGRLSLTGDEYLQEFIDTQQGQAVEVSGLYIVQENDVVLLGVCRQWIGETSAGATQFAFSGSIGPIADGQADPALRDFEQLAAQARNIGRTLLTGNAVGLIGIDFIWHLPTQSLYCIEINPRIAASAELYNEPSKSKIVRWHVDACEGRLDVRQLRSTLGGSTGLLGNSTQHAKLIVYATRDSLCPDWPKIPESFAWPPAVRIADRPVVNSPLIAGQPVCTLLTSAKSVEACRATLLRAAQQLDL